MRGGSGAVSYYDAHFGLVLDKLEAIGKAQDTVVLVTGVRAPQYSLEPGWEGNWLAQLQILTSAFCLSRTTAGI